MNQAFKRYIMVRHGESLANARAPDAGHDSSLTKTGWSQAEDLAKFLPAQYEIDAILCSPFRRCLETSKHLSEACGVGVKLEPLLHEFFNSRWFGHDLRYLEFPSLAALCETHDWVEGTYARNRWWPRIAERAQEVDDRLRRLVRFLSSPAFEATNIVCIGHWASVASMATALKPNINIPEVGNATVTVIEHHPTQNSVVMKDFDGFLRTST